MKRELEPYIMLYLQLAACKFPLASIQCELNFVIHIAESPDLVCLLHSELLELRLLHYSFPYPQCLEEGLAFSTQVFIEQWI